MNTFAAVLLAGAAACAATTAGIAAVMLFDQAARRYSILFVSFAAGVLVTVSLLHLVPHAHELTSAAPGYVLAGLLGLYLIDRLAESHDAAPERSPVRGGLVPIMGIGLHSLLDGVIFAVTFTADVTTGVLAAVGMVLHEFPEGVILVALLERQGYDRRKSFWTAFLAAGITTPAGALVAYPVVQHLAARMLGLLLALSGGALVYLGVAHLLPATLKERRAGTLICLGAGVVLALLALMARQS